MSLDHTTRTYTLTHTHIWCGIKLSLFKSFLIPISVRPWPWHMHALCTVQTSDIWRFDFFSRFASAKLCNFTKHKCIKPLKLHYMIKRITSDFFHHSLHPMPSPSACNISIWWHQIVCNSIWCLTWNVLILKLENLILYARTWHMCVVGQSERERDRDKKQSLITLGNNVY